MNNKTDITAGFRIKNVTPLSEMAAEFYEMEHIATGMKLGWMKNSDVNKTFAIAFRTVPEDDTGVFHILEHCVLQGSENYPVKAPFVHLMKNSMATFLNAMTFPDKTVFPVSSRNEKDFENLMCIYLDAVFHPMLHENENIFLQEGWHYETDGDVLSCSGVVLNEMKGDHASVDSMLALHVTEALFPDNCYSCESGGDPECIVTLDYDTLRETHKKFYHPSNAFILLDGDMNIERTLEIIDRKFLSCFSRRNMVFPIPLQKPVCRSCDYAFQAEDEEDMTGYLGLGYVIGTYSDQKKLYAAGILADYLADSNASPLKKAVLERGLGCDVTVDITDDIKQPFVLFTIRGIDPDRREEAEAVTADVLRQIKEDGPDRKLLDALLCQTEFAAREKDPGEDTPGVACALSILETWMYGGDPVQRFQNTDMFEELHQEIENGTFTEYLDEIFCQNPHRASVLMKPSAAYMDEADTKEENRLKAIFEGSSAEEREQIRLKEMHLNEWQEAPESQAALNCIPVLNPDDITEDPMKIDTRILDDGTIWHSVNTGGICYLRLYFPIDPQLYAYMSEISFLTTLYGQLPLRSMDKASLDREKSRVFGDFQVYAEIISSPADENPGSYFCVDVSYLQEKEDDALSLMSEIMTDTDFAAEDEIYEILYQQQESLQQAMIMDGHSMAMLSARSGISLAGRLSNAVEGPAFAGWIAAEAEKKDNPELLISVLENLALQIINPDKMLISMTCDGDCRFYVGKIRSLLTGMECVNDTELSLNRDFFEGHDREKPSEDVTLLPVSVPVAFSAAAGNMRSLHIENSGSWKVLEKLVSMDYLWNEIRVRGGAYGTGMSVDADDDVGYFSYRDPDPYASLDVYRNVPTFIENYCDGNSDLTGIKIGAAAESEPVLTPGSQGKVADQWYLADISDEFRKERRKQLLHTEVKDLRKLAKDLKRLNSQMRVCIVTSPETD